MNLNHEFDRLIMIILYFFIFESNIFIFNFVLHLFIFVLTIKKILEKPAYCFCQKKIIQCVVASKITSFNYI
jgi:hypothetical protein